MKLFLIVITHLLFFSSTILAQKKSTVTSSTPAKPKLVVGIVVDQMRWDYLYRFEKRFTNNGFNKLRSQGFNCEQTFIPYAPTVTAAGHTCVYTGSVPAFHGIVGNDWQDVLTGKDMYCVSDSTVIPIGTTSSQGKMSPRNLFATTIADVLRVNSNFTSKVYGIALKDRGAILPAGFSANGAFWFDDVTGNWVSSSYYYDALPVWLQTLNEQKKYATWLQKPWETFYPINTYTASAANDSLYKRKTNGEKTNYFPHYFDKTDKKYAPLRYSPYGNTYTLETATEIIKNEKLGTSPSNTDMLFVSLSSTDYLGHAFGPTSIEVEDMYIRLDIDLATFVTYLDKTVGAGNYLLFVTADHAAPEAVSYMQAHKISSGLWNAEKMASRLNDSLYQKFGVKNLITRMYEYQVYLNDAAIEKSNIDKEAIENYVVNYLNKQPEVLQAFAYDNIDEVVLPDAVKKRFINGYNKKRSGSIQILLKPQYVDGHNVNGTDHGSPYNYDTHIPLIWYGWHIPKGSTHNTISMADIAPTIAALLHIPEPNASIGKPITQIVP